MAMQCVFCEAKDLSFNILLNNAYFSKP